MTEQISRSCWAFVGTWPWGWSGPARFRATPGQILVEMFWVYPYEFPRDEVMPLRIEDGGIVIQSERRGWRVTVRVDAAEVVPILMSWGYPAFRPPSSATTRPSAATTRPSKQIRSDPPL